MRESLSSGRPRERRFSLGYADAVHPLRPANLQTDSPRHLERRGRENVPLGRTGRCAGSRPIRFYGLASVTVRYLWSYAAASSPSQTMAGRTKVALDFLLRPARMTSRPAFRTKLSIRRENSLGDGKNRCCAEGADMAVWFMRRLQRLFCEEFTLSRRRRIATDGWKRGNTNK